MDKKGNGNQLLNWLNRELYNDNCTELKTNIVVDTPWSIVIKVNAGQKCLYLKNPDMTYYDWLIWAN